MRERIEGIKGEEFVEKIIGGERRRKAKLRRWWTTTRSKGFLGI